MKYKKILNSLLVLALSGTMVWTAGCSRLSQRLKPSPKTVLEKVSPSAYPAFLDDMALDGLEHGVVQSLAFYNRIPQTRKFKFGEDLFDARHMIQTLEHFLTFIRTRPDSQDIRKYITNNYWVYRSVGGKKSGRVLFTGYFEPILYGLNEKSPEYRYPVYARPEDIVSIDLSEFSKKYKGDTIVGRVTDHKVIPYYDRKAIESHGALDGNVKALAWVSNPVDPFFLQIQGSGKIYLDTGEVLNVHYHMANGHPYRSIGKLLIDKNKIPREKMSMQAIRSYLKAHPDEIEEILNYNPSYVFFKTEKEAPIGYIEVKLTPGRSVALDRRIFPHGALGFIEAQKPLIDGSKKIHEWVDCSRFVLNQDTGGAIRGPGRADMFWGNGPYAEIAAGHPRHHGNLFLMVLTPKDE